MSLIIEANAARVGLLGIALAGCSGGSSAPTSDAGPPAPAPGVAVVNDSVPLARCQLPSPSAAEGPVYKTQVTLGSQSFDLLVDTGSSEMVVAGASCTSCGDVAPRYAPGATATPVASPPTIAYSGIYVGGQVYDDTARLGEAPAATVSVLSVAQQTNLFAPGVLCSGFQGIFGLASPRPSEKDYFPQLVAAGRVPDVFSLGLCPGGGSLWLGGYDPAATTGPVQFTPMDDDGLYEVEVTGVSIGSTAVQLSRPTVPGVVDTGNPTLGLPAAAHDALMQALLGSADFQRIFGGPASFAPQGCATVAASPSEVDAALPPLTLFFAGSPPFAVTAPATSSYLEPYAAGEKTTYCIDFVETDDGDSTADGGSVDLSPVNISAPFLRTSVVIFDRQNHRMGFAPHACP